MGMSTGKVISQENNGAGVLDELNTTLSIIKKEIKMEKCNVCGSKNTYYHEEHPDTGMDEIVLRCRDCEAKKPKLPLRFRVREFLSIKFNSFWGKRIVSPLFKLARWTARKGGNRCTWCGAQPGFSSSYSSKGLRCSTLGRDCSKY